MPDQVDGAPGDIDLPAELVQPARRALLGAGYTRLEQLNGVSEAQLRKLHGIGPKAIRQLRQALAARDMALAGEQGGA